MVVAAFNNEKALVSSDYTTSKFAKVSFEALGIIAWAASDPGILNGNEEKKKV